MDSRRHLISDEISSCRSIAASACRPSSMATYSRSYSGQFFTVGVLIALISLSVQGLHMFTRNLNRRTLMMNQDDFVPICSSFGALPSFPTPAASTGRPPPTEPGLRYVTSETTRSANSFAEASGRLRARGSSVMASSLSFLDLKVPRFLHWQNLPVFTPFDYAMPQISGNSSKYSSPFLRHVVPCKISWTDLATGTHSLEAIFLLRIHDISTCVIITMFRSRNHFGSGKVVVNGRLSVGGNPNNVVEGARLGVLWQKPPFLEAKYVFVDSEFLRFASRLELRDVSYTFHVLQNQVVSEIICSSSVLCPFHSLVDVTEASVLLCLMAWKSSVFSQGIFELQPIWLLIVGFALLIFCFYIEVFYCGYYGPNFCTIVVLEDLFSLLVNVWYLAILLDDSRVSGSLFQVFLIKTQDLGVDSMDSFEDLDGLCTYLTSVAVDVWSQHLFCYFELVTLMQNSGLSEALEGLKTGSSTNFRSSHNFLLFDQLIPEIWLLTREGGDWEPMVYEVLELGNEFSKEVMLDEGNTIRTLSMHSTQAYTYFAYQQVPGANSTMDTTLLHLQQCAMGNHFDVVEYVESSNLNDVDVHDRIISEDLVGGPRDDNETEVTAWLLVLILAQIGCDVHNMTADSSFQVAASWQANKNFMLKGNGLLQVIGESQGITITLEIYSLLCLLFLSVYHVGVFMVVFAILIILYLGFVESFSTKQQACTYNPDNLCKPALATALFSTSPFVLGAVTSVLSGFLEMKIATYANARTTLEARKGVGKAFITAFRSGSVMGFLRAANKLLVLFITINVLKIYYGDEWEGLFEAITGYGLGGSSMALFGRVGGGIYTKAADVGDIVGMGFDLFGSYAEASCVAFVVASISSFGINHEFTAMLFPLLVSSMGILVCLITTLFATDIFEIKVVDEIEPALKNQLIISTVLMTTGTAFVSWVALPSSFAFFNFGAQKTVTNWQLFLCVAVGLWGGLIIGFVTEYYTSNAYSPVQDVADSCRNGAATNVIFGLALGYKSVIIPIFAIAFSIFVSFSSAAMYGIAMATLGMLGTIATGLLVGAMLPYWFSAMTMKSVGSAAFKMVEEIRRQFNEIPGIMEGTTKPDYATCVKISTDASIKEMIPPGALVILTELQVLLPAHPGFPFLVVFTTFVSVFEAFVLLLEIFVISLLQPIVGCLSALMR